jgi:hypothetical protein
MDDLDHVFAHSASAAAILSSMMGWLPPLCAIVGLIWYLLQIWESQTVQGLVAAWRIRRATAGQVQHILEHPLVEPPPAPVEATQERATQL